MKRQRRDGPSRGPSRAPDVLTQRTLFVVDTATYAKVVAALDAPPRPNDKLRRTMRTRALWNLAYPLLSLDADTSAGEFPADKN